MLESPIFGPTAFLVYRTLLWMYLLGSLIADAVVSTLEPKDVYWKPEYWVVSDRATVKLGFNSELRGVRILGTCSILPTGMIISLMRLTYLILGPS